MTDQNEQDRETAKAMMRSFFEMQGASPEEARAAVDELDDLTPTWTYTCGICGAVVEPDDVGEHTAEEKAKPTWPGWISYSRTDALEAQAESTPVKGEEER